MREFGTVIVGNLHLRDAPNGKIIGWLKREDCFEVVGAPVDQQENRWLPVKMKHTGQDGWLAQKRHDGSAHYVDLWREQNPNPQAKPFPKWLMAAIAVAVLTLAALLWPGK